MSNTHEAQSEMTKQDTLPPLEQERAAFEAWKRTQTDGWTDFEVWQARAALAAQAPQQAPAGFVMVPVEPTPDMLSCIVHSDYPADWEAGKRLQRDQRGDNRVPFKTEYEIAVGQYQRLLAAAPQAAPAPAPQALTPLTEEQVAEACGWRAGLGLKPMPGELRIARAIERAHGIGAASAGGEG
jgi:hypothetical protein